MPNRLRRLAGNFVIAPHDLGLIEYAYDFRQANRPPEPDIIRQERQAAEVEASVVPRRRLMDAMPQARNNRPNRGLMLERAIREGDV